MIRRALAWLPLGALVVAALLADAMWLLALTPLFLLGALPDKPTRRVDPVDAQWATAPKEIDEWERWT